MKKPILTSVLIIIGMTLTMNAHAFSFRPQWVPQTQFAGYYMAAKQGFYKAEGIDLTIKDGGPNVSGLQEINEGKTEFASAWLISAIQMKEKGQNIVLIGQIFQKPALLLVAKKDSGIESLEDFPGHTLGVWPGHFQVPPKALIRKNRIRGVEIVQQGFDVKPFVNGELDIASAMRYNEYHQILAEGVQESDLVIFDYSDLEMALPEDGIYVNESFYQANKDACKKFMTATMKGWAYALAHKKETAEYMAGLANATPFKTTADKQLSMLEEVGKLIDLETYKLSTKGFDAAIEALKSTRMISQDVDYTSFVTDIAQ